MANKKIIVSVISDLTSDQRVHKVCNYLLSKNANVLCVGRRFNNSKSLGNRSYEVKRLRCFFRNGPMQYLEFNLRLFCFLLFNRADLYLSNDLDTLAPNYLVSSMRAKPLVYDSHEYFTGMAELEHRHFKRKIWKKLEDCLLPRIQYSFTVNQSIQHLYKLEYGIQMEVVRNVPEMSGTNFLTNPTNFQLIIQGAGLNEGRGLEELIEAMSKLPDRFSLLIVGSGTVWEKCKALTKKFGLNDRIQFKDRIPFDELHELTRAAWLGLSLDKPVSVNNTFSLPNKIFDYIHAGIPILASLLTEVKTIIEQYSVGYCIDKVTPEAIAAAIEFIYEHPEQYQTWKENTIHAAQELNWELESKNLDKVYDGLLL